MIPETLPELAEAGYRLDGSGHCQACGARLEWFWTPRNRKMPMSLKQEIRVGEDSIYPSPSMTRYEPHFAVCPHAERFRRKR